jgi:PAS domain S-box-containing protein
MNPSESEVPHQVHPSAVPELPLLLQSEEACRFLVASVTEYAIFMLDPEGRVASWNAGAERIKGYRAEEIVGQHFSRFYPDEDLQWGKPAYELRVASAEGRFEDEGWRVRKDGSRFWANVVITALRDEAGRLVGFAKVTRDLSERRKAEDRLRAYAAQLEQRNRELEEFAYVASHDLQEPLRKIQAFGDRLKTRCGEALNEQGRDYLARMQNAAARMQILIDDLLAFSRVTTQAEPFLPVDLIQIAREVISDLEATIERSGGRVELGELPTIEADPVQMRQLLQNLSSNALKFRRPDEPPVVTISSRPLDPAANPPPHPFAPRQFCQLVVEDNGIGFDEKYLDRIFNPFQRLHGRDEYEGTGIGLAICRKIVERHGGAITARSAPGRGARFIVTLPLRQSEGGSKT